MALLSVALPLKNTRSLFSRINIFVSFHFFFFPANTSSLFYFPFEGKNYFFPDVTLLPRPQSVSRRFIYTLRERLARWTSRRVVKKGSVFGYLYARPIL